MTSWQFLLQREGETQWLSLNGEHQELKEGKYRLVAQGEARHTPVKIDIVHFMKIAAGKVKKRSQSRIKETNGEGLMVIFPYTHLDGGIWEVQCALSPEDPQIQHQVKFKVLPQTLGDRPPASLVPPPAPPIADAISPPAPPKAPPEIPVFQPLSTVESPPMVALDSPPESDDEAITPFSPLGQADTEVIPMARVSEPNDPQRSPTDLTLSRPTSLAPKQRPRDTAAIAQDLLNHSVRELEQLLEAELNPPPEGPPVEDDRSDRLFCPYRVALEQGCVVWQRHQPVILTGRIESPTSAPGEGPPHFAGTLLYRLINPQNGEILGEYPQIFPTSDLPVVFQQQWRIPGEWDFSLILGQLLWIPPTVSPEPSPPVPMADFQLMANPQELMTLVSRAQWQREEKTPPKTLRAIAPARDSQEQETDSTQALEALLADPWDTDGDNAPESGELSGPLTSRAMADPGRPYHHKAPPAIAPLRSQLFRTFTEKLAERSALPPAPPATRLWSKMDHFAALPRALPPATPGLKPAVDPELAAILSHVAQELGLESPPSDRPSPTINRQRHPTPAPPLDPAEQEFEEMMAQLLQTSQGGSELAHGDPASPGPEPMLPHFNGVAVDWGSQEVVIIDEAEMLAIAPAAEPSPGFDSSGVPYPKEALMGDRLEDSPSITPPIPQLQIKKSPLKAGDTVAIYVTLPPYEDGIYVKLWMKDRQSKTLVSGPHHLVEFDRSAQGHLSTIYQFVLPPGFLELDIEAIAINPHTQEESHKQTLSQTIAPGEDPGDTFPWQAFHL